MMAVKKGKQTRKTSGQIKEEILSHLKKGPLSTKRLSDLLKSNWSTINAHLEELEREGNVREIYSRENLKVYVRSDYPVFYGLPLDDKKLKDSLFLLSRIIEKWREKKKQAINKTTMQKIAVNVARNNSLDIPVVRFHYGKVLTAYLEPGKYQETMRTYEIKEPPNSEFIEKAVEKEIEEGGHSNLAWMEKKNQYKAHEDMKIFDLSDRVFYIISKDRDDRTNELLNIFSNILLFIPTSERYSYLFEKYHEFVRAVYFIFNSKEFEKKEYKKGLLNEILDTFSSIWQALTTEFFFEDIEPAISKEFEEIVDYIKDSKTKTYYFEIDNKLNNLLDYKTSLTIKETKLDETEEKMLNILLEGADEE